MEEEHRRFMAASINGRDKSWLEESHPRQSKKKTSSPTDPYNEKRERATWGGE